MIHKVSSNINLHINRDSYRDSYYMKFTNKNNVVIEIDSESTV